MASRHPAHFTAKSLGEQEEILLGHLAALWLHPAGGAVLGTRDGTPVAGRWALAQGHCVTLLVL